MKEFAQLLSEYIQAKNIRVYAMASYCGLDRSEIYDILSGNSVPSSTETVKKMSSYMQLTPFENETFLETYKISSAGYGNYHRRKDVMNFLNNFNSLSIPVSPLAASDILPLEEIEKVHFPAAFKGNSRVSRVLTSILMQEARKENGYIQLLMQPTASIFNSFLNYIVQGKLTLTIDHIFCMNNSTKLAFTNRDYNLTCLEAILPLYTADCDYRPYYFYDNILSRMDEFHPFPYMIITSEYAAMIAGNFEKCIIYHDSEFIGLFKDLFNGYLSKVSPLISKYTTLPSLLNYAKDIEPSTSYQNTDYVFEMIPCIAPFLTDEMVNESLNPDVPFREEFIAAYSKYRDFKYKSLQHSDTVFIFSEEGIKYFLEHGLIEECPSSLHKPLKLEYRRTLILSLLQNSSIIQLRMLKKNIGTIPGGINIYITSKSGYIQFITPQGQVTFLDIGESSLMNTFRDFFETMDDDLFYSYEEMVFRIQELLVQ